MKNYPFVVLFYLGVHMACSQVTSLGVKTGVNSSKYLVEQGFRGSSVVFEGESITSFQNLKPKPGFTFSLSAGHELQNNFAVFLDISYSRFSLYSESIYDNGFKTPREGISRLWRKEELDYLMIPLKFGYVFGSKLKIIPKIGVAASLFVRAGGERLIVGNNTPGTIWTGDYYVAVEKVEKEDFDYQSTEWSFHTEVESSFALRDKFCISLSIGVNNGQTDIQSFPNLKTPKRTLFFLVGINRTFKWNSASQVETSH